MSVSALYLGAAIISEVVATSFLKASNGFKNLVPTLIVVVGYSASFFLLSLALRKIPLGVAYAIWSAVGTALVTAIGWFVYKQSLSLAAGFGIALTVVGVVLINLGTSPDAH